MFKLLALGRGETKAGKQRKKDLLPHNFLFDWIDTNYYLILSPAKYPKNAIWTGLKKMMMNLCDDPSLFDSFRLYAYR